MKFGFLASLPFKRKSSDAPVPTPDLNRIMKSDPDPVSAKHSVEDDTKNADMTSWRKSDMDRLSACWKEALLTNFGAESVGHFRRAIHNLHGASNIYGGDALMRLTAVLQAAARDVQRLRQNTELITLLISACQITQPDDRHEAAFNQVCETLEAKFLDAASQA
jgi:hypothetical protein